MSELLSSGLAALNIWPNIWLNICPGVMFVVTSPNRFAPDTPDHASPPGGKVGAPPIWVERKPGI
jgi:hypothetical protein